MKCCQDREEFEKLVDEILPDIVIADVHLESDDGIEVIRKTRECFPDMGFIVISSDESVETRTRAVHVGADGFIAKPIDPSQLTSLIRSLTSPVNNADGDIVLNGSGRKMTHSYKDILGVSEAMESVTKLVDKVSNKDLSVLIWGESGTGKELFARALHDSSHRKNENFVALNCAAMPDNLVESELFGHEKGAFTGAITSRPGKIRESSGGTLFLDEIGELPLSIQPKLLRALQEKKVVSIGGHHEIDCDFRLVCATNRDLIEEVKEGRFREDLFYRVAVFPIKLPPLRQRKEDLELLLSHFLKLEGMSNPRISKQAFRMLSNYKWPGNVRELVNFAQAVPLFCENDLIDMDALDSYFGSRMDIDREETGDPTIDFAETTENFTRPVRKIDDLQKKEVMYALKYFKGNVAEAATALGMGRATLYKYIKKHQINVPVS